MGGGVGVTAEEVNPVFFAQPLAPLVAGWMANVAFDEGAACWEGSVLAGGYVLPVQDP